MYPWRRLAVAVNGPAADFLRRGLESVERVCLILDSCNNGKYTVNHFHVAKVTFGTAYLQILTLVKGNPNCQQSLQMHCLPKKVY